MPERSTAPQTSAKQREYRRLRGQGVARAEAAEAAGASVASTYRWEPAALGPPECGTQRAYDRHLREREEPCPDCRKANAAAKAQQGHTKVRDHARAALVRLHRDEFDQLVAAEGGDSRARNRARAELARRHAQEFRRLLTDEFTRFALETP